MTPDLKNDPGAAMKLTKFGLALLALLALAMAARFAGPHASAAPTTEPQASTQQ